MATVLVVDDDRKLLKMLSRTLVYEGLDVLTAENGEEALRQVEAHHPDLIILDWLMPNLDGIAVVDRLRAAHNETLILMLTARDAIEDRVEGLESGADDYLVKPFAPAELLARVHALLRRGATSAASQPLVYADLVLDPATRETRRGQRAFTLTPTEFELLHYRGRCWNGDRSWRPCGGMTSAARTTCWRSTSAICARRPNRAASRG